MFSLSSFVPLDPLRVIPGNITTQLFIANADDVARGILLFTIATAFIFLQAICLYHLRQNLSQKHVSRDLLRHRGRRSQNLFR